MLTLLFILLAAEAHPAAQPTRTAKDILSDYQKSIGDESAWKSHRTVTIEREVSIKAMRFTASERMRIAKGGKMVSNSTFPGMGAFTIGTNGRQAWSQDPINGLRVLKGAEAEDIRLAAAWNPEWRLLSLYKSADVVPAPAEANGAAWECIQFGKKEGNPVTLCFDAATHLRAMEKGTKASPGGELPYVCRYSDWRPVDGVQVWHKEDVTLGPITMEAQVKSVVFNTPIPAKDFDVPKKAGGASSGKR